MPFLLVSSVPDWELKLHLEQEDSNFDLTVLMDAFQNAEP